LTLLDVIKSSYGNFYDIIRNFVEWLKRTAKTSVSKPIDFTDTELFYLLSVLFNDAVGN
jgi:hypothetical protein